MRFIKFALVAIIFGAVPITRAGAEEPDDQQVRFLIAALDRRITIDKDAKQLTEFLNSIMTRGSEPNAAKGAKNRFTVIVDEERFKLEALGMFDLERQIVRFDVRLEDVCLDAVLRIAGEQMPCVGVLLVRNDYVEIVPRIRACQELKLTLTGDQPMPLLIHRIFSKTPVEKAFLEIAERYNQNIVIAPQTQGKKDTLISARLVNVPVATAVETLAELAGLKVVRKPNLFYVTTAEQAAQLDAEKK